MNDVCLTDHFLIAMPQLDDPNFFHSVTYICQHDTEGAMGVMINQPMDMKLGDILKARLDWQAQQQLDQLAPLRLRVPSGSSLAIDYRQNPPVLRVKLQEMFGCTQTPTIADGRIELKIHLLSPAGRPLQVTQDLAGFWQNSYHEVKKDMKGRYPKHPWPDDPLHAEATRRTKTRRS